MKGLRRDFSIYKGTNRDLQVYFTLGFCNYNEMDENDMMYLEVIDYRNNDAVVIEKVVKGDNFFSFVPSDTEELDVGYYRYNVKFRPANSDEYYQIIAPSLFHIKAGE